MAKKEEPKISKAIAKNPIGGPGFSYSKGDAIFEDHLKDISPEFCDGHPGWLVEEYKKKSAGSNVLDITVDAKIKVVENGGKVERKIIEVKPEK